MRKCAHIFIQLCFKDNGSGRFLNFFLKSGIPAVMHQHIQMASSLFFAQQR